MVGRIGGWRNLGGWVRLSWSSNITLLKLFTPRYQNPASQDPHGEERGLVRKWQPAILIGFSLVQVGIGNKTKLMGRKREECLAFLSAFFCGGNHLIAQMGEMTAKGGHCRRGLIHLKMAKFQIGPK